MAVTTVEVEVCECDICGHPWYKRTDNPVQCPKCKSTSWNKIAEKEKEKKNDK